MDTRAAGERTLRARSHGNYVRGKAHNQDRIAVAHDPENTTAARSDSQQIAGEPPMDAAEAILDHQRSKGRSGKHGEEDVTQESGPAKRKAKSATRHRKRDNKRARVEVHAATVGRYGTQHGLQLIVGDDPSTPINFVGAVPWEHRGLLGQTRGRRAAGDNNDT